MQTETTNRPTAAQRQEMIAVAAYYLAERRKFAAGDANADWLRAERAIDDMIAGRLLDRATPDTAGHARIRNALQFA